MTAKTTVKLVTCPDCKQERPLSYKARRDILTGRRTERCRPCSVVLRSNEARKRAIARLASGIKCCCVCQQEKPIAEFNRASKHMDGLASRCKLCDRDDAAANYRRNREPRIVQARIWALANPEARRRIASKHARRWRAAHPERAEGRKRERTDFDSILAEFGLVCHICGDTIEAGDLHFDHVVPLSRGGAHGRDNIRPAHALCNLRKGSKLMEELAA